MKWSDAIVLNALYVQFTELFIVLLLASQWRGRGGGAILFENVIFDNVQFTWRQRFD